jgi:pantoate--beta-alanine ligase
MRVETTIAGLRAARQRLAGAVGLVPTMGALHEGHLSLVRMAKARCAHVVATIFVNPTQFAPNEDFSKYPRTFEADCELLAAEGVELLFAPDAAEMYPAGASTRVEVGPVGDRLDGASRPGHFVGVATVVAKLFHIVGPNMAFFGQKDAAQVAVLRQMVRDLNFNLELVVGPIVREPDGLAMSSRNRYLSPEERRQAVILSRALEGGTAAFQSGESKAEKLIEHIEKVLATERGIRMDYATLVNASTLLPLEIAVPGALLAVAAWVGTTRLIDNQML